MQWGTGTWRVDQRGQYWKPINLRCHFWGLCKWWLLRCKNRVFQCLHPSQTGWSAHDIWMTSLELIHPVLMLSWRKHSWRLAAETWSFHLEMKGTYHLPKLFLRGYIIWYRYMRWKKLPQGSYVWVKCNPSHCPGAKMELCPSHHRAESLPWCQ